MIAVRTDYDCSSLQIGFPPTNIGGQPVNLTPNSFFDGDIVVQPCHAYIDHPLPFSKELFQTVSFQAYAGCFCISLKFISFELPSVAQTQNKTINTTSG